MVDKKLSPRAFLKERRPERFSDSFVQESPGLERPLLEYHLDTLTNRSQETDFQTFSRNLLQREVCPNLLPQTGPTGGGDSKVDSETYPVADDLSLVWYVGTGREAASERWAFAISAKADWRAKVQSDVAKIAGTNRGYSKAFFVTNQFVRDKDRAEVEDALGRKHGLDVRIFDRTWILDRVFQGHHEQLVIEDLKLQCSVRTNVRQGPLDAKRESDLLELEKRIEAAVQEGRLGFQLADDCISAVMLARSLERPRTEIDGQLARAERVCLQCGSAHQQLVAAYQRAWTAFWWYEDFPEFVRTYAIVEQRAKGSENIYHLELLSNCWYLLNMVARSGACDLSDSMQPHTALLTTELDRFVSDESRPNAALQARSRRLIIDLLNDSSDNVAASLGQLKDVVLSCKNLIGFPLEPLVEILTSIGAAFGNVPAYDDLCDTIESVWSQRKGDIAAAKLLLGRGAQQLDSGKPVQAIRTLGKALVRLFKEESRDELIRALYLCSSAYEQIGLLWAARGSMLIAASLATDEFWKYQDVTPLQAACYSRMKWLELTLSRIPQTLGWHNVDRVVRSILLEQGFTAHSREEDDLNFDTILGIQFLRADIWDLRSLGKLPASLESADLFFAPIALKYALGDEESAFQVFRSAGSDKQALREFIVRWRDQPATKDLVNAPQFGTAQKLCLEATVAGCRVKAECQNAPTCLALAESILGILESLLATGLADRVFAREPELSVKISSSDFTEFPFTYEVQQAGGRPKITVRCAVFDPNRMSVDEQGRLKEQLLKLILDCIGHIFLVGDLDTFVERLFGDERAVERAIHFTWSFVVLGNVLGNSASTSISDWIDEASEETPLVRGSEWDAEERSQRKSTVSQSEPLAWGEGPPPEDLVNPEKIRHSEMQTVSIIREPLWVRAGWGGTGFVVHPKPDSLPMLSPVFRDADAAKELFTQLRRDVGERDDRNQLRVTIVRGIRKDNPYAYRVIIGSNVPRNIRENGMRVIACASRVNTMEPQSSENLDRFLVRFNQVNAFQIAPCVVNADMSPRQLLFGLAITKNQLFVRDAWQIGLNDVDMVGVFPDDSPIIPQGVADVPFEELLAWRNSRR